MHWVRENCKWVYKNVLEKDWPKEATTQQEKVFISEIIHAAWDDTLPAPIVPTPVEEKKAACGAIIVTKKPSTNQVTAPACPHCRLSSQPSAPMKPWLAGRRSFRAGILVPLGILVQLSLLRIAVVAGAVGNQCETRPSSP